MSNACKKKSPLELAELILEHNPGASFAMIANVISEWGDLLDDQKYETHESNGFDSVVPHALPTTLRRVRAVHR